MTEDTEIVDPQAQAADNAIQDFRQLHDEALHDTGHAEHTRRASELKGMYERRYAGEPNQFDPSDGQARPENSIDEVAADAMQPLTEQEFAEVIGPESDFGLSVDVETYGFDTELQNNASKAFAAASLNGAQARQAASAYYESIQPTYDVGVAASASTALVKHEYGDQNYDKAIAATNRMIRQIAGDELYKFVGRSGLGSHPRFVGEAVRLARQRGYF
jgi:hypothetical protein